MEDLGAYQAETPYVLPEDVFDAQFERELLENPVINASNLYGLYDARIKNILSFEEFDVAAFMEQCSRQKIVSKLLPDTDPRNYENQKLAGSRQQG